MARISASTRAHDPHVPNLDFALTAREILLFRATELLDPWNALANFPILQKVVLVNPLVYASEGLRGTLVPQFPHLPIVAVLPALVIFDSLLLMVGLRQFRHKAVT